MIILREVEDRDILRLAELLPKGFVQTTYGNSSIDKAKALITGFSSSMVMKQLQAIPVNTRRPMLGWKIY